MVSIIRYTENSKHSWNKFNSFAKNPLFMFDREYMDYHKDRFCDHSLMFYHDDELIAILPMNEDDKTLVSHGGLSYGGFITGHNMKQHLMNECFEALIDYAVTNGFKSILYKCIPHIYHEQPAEEDRYSLFLYNASLKKIEPSTVINLKYPLKMAKGRKAQISRAKREGVVIRELTDEEDFNQFISLENEILMARHNTKAVHTGAELALLYSRFPSCIHLCGGFLDNNLISGAVIFEYKQLLHTQYMAANNIARQIGALDLVIYTLIEKYKKEKLWLDFGISSENGGLYLNEGLISQKEGFGGRTCTYETWSLSLKNNGVVK